MNPCSRKAREYGLKLFFLKTEVEKSGYSKKQTEVEAEYNPFVLLGRNVFLLKL